MKFSLATLYVNDMEKSLTFYNEILEMPILGRHSLCPGKELIFLGAENDVHLELIPSDKGFSYSGFSIGFNVEDLPAVKGRLNAYGYKIEREFSPSAATTLCFLYGPNGEEVELIENK